MGSVFQLSDIKPEIVSQELLLKSFGILERKSYVAQDSEVRMLRIRSLPGTHKIPGGPVNPPVPGIPFPVPLPSGKFPVFPYFFTAFLLLSMSVCENEIQAEKTWQQQLWMQG